MDKLTCDVAIIGGGPAGATVGGLLKKYNPALDVCIFEREKFPRDHVGESLLPMVPEVLHELGVWDKVEAQNFPIKLGAAYRWGKESDKDLYYFHFLPDGKFSQTARPGKYEGERTKSTFQVDRSVYDKILLDHAEELGCHVFQSAKVVEIPKQGDSVQSLSVVHESEKFQVEAKYYVDASGGESLLRREFEVGIESPTSLRNIAVWDYWQNSEWAERVGQVGTYVYVLSLGYGWIWFIPLSDTRTSIGFITSADYFKKSGLSTEEIYTKALGEQPLVKELTKNSTRENRLEATKDWSFVASRLTGENWFLAGDACGFADPILAAGLTLAQVGARRVAFSLLSIFNGDQTPEWIKEQYNRIQRRNTLNHIRFADYWYSANEQFSDLKDYCSQIAKDAGLTLDSDAAFQWLGTGGFTDELNGLPFSGTYTLTAVKQFTSRFGNKDTSWKVYENNILALDTDGSVKDKVALYESGHVISLDCLKKGNQIWPLNGVYLCLYNALSREQEIELVAERYMYEMGKLGFEGSRDVALVGLEALESLITEGWVTATYDPSKPKLDVGMPEAVT